MSHMVCFLCVCVYVCVRVYKLGCVCDIALMNKFGNNKCPKIILLF